MKHHPNHRPLLRSITLTLLLAAAGWSLPALASPDTACNVRANDLVNQYLYPPVNGDTKFFTSQGGAPNVIFLLDNSCSMLDMPVYPAQTSNGCSDANYDAMVDANGNPVANNPDYDPDFKGLMTDGHAYQVHNSGGLHDQGDFATACSNLYGYAGSTVVAQCQSCLSTKGYYRDNNTSSRYTLFSGNLLNIFPPKYVGARKVTKDVIKSVQKVRMGIVNFDSGSNPFGGHWLGGNTLNPSCSSTMNDTSQFQNNRNSLINSINNTSQLQFNTMTPLAETLLNIGEYYTDGDDPFSNTTVNTTLPSWGFTGFEKSGFTSSTSANQKSICGSCQFTSVVIITDGEPTADDSVPDPIKNDGAPCTSCGGHYLANVAYWFHHNDLRPDFAGQQSLTTYTVSFAVDNQTAINVLKYTAQDGGGFYTGATSANQLEHAIMDVLKDVQSRSSSFAVTPLANVQSSAVQSVLVPRFTPNRNAVWKGQLFRFDFVSEFAVGRDLDGNGDQSGFFLVDKGCQNVNWQGTLPAGCVPIRAATQADMQPGMILGDFYKASSWTPGAALTTTPAVPYWDAGQLLQARAPATRRIFTAIDDSTGTNVHWKVIPFDILNGDDAAIAPYLGLNDTFCGQLLTQIGLLNVPAANVMSTCAQAVIQYARGCAAGDLSQTCATRQYVLGDIFHSSPLIEEPPETKYMMTNPVLGGTQDILAGDTPPAAGPDPWDTFQTTYAHRTRIAFVGSNDGLLHAFDAGDWDAAMNNGPGQPPGGFDRGTGQELWAFVPPDLLPKLKDLIQGSKHRFFVDGTPWIRDAWHDTDGDGKREANEWRTVLVQGERRGGNHYLAFDITHADQPTYVPDLLWVWPQPGTREEYSAGQSWTDLMPFPPPIGPIRYKSSAGTSSYMGSNYVERWVVAVAGGFDPNQYRGRGFDLLDLFTGNPLWEFSQDTDLVQLPGGTTMAAPTNTEDAVRANLHFSIAAPPALTGWGEMSTQPSNAPAFFDTMTVGDTGGQLWVAHFANPDPSTWTAARVFQENASAGVNYSTFRSPFFQIAAYYPEGESGYLRVYLGSGDRAHLKDDGGGQCTADNLFACSRHGCTDVHGDVDYSLVSGKTGGIGVHWDSEANYKDELYSPTAPTASCASGTLQIAFKRHLGTCDPWTDDRTISCDMSQDSCTVSGSEGILPPSSCLVDQSPNSRFYAIRVFGPTTSPQDLESDPATFDTNRSSDDSGWPVSLVDATSGTTLADSFSPGWFRTYDTQSERTATPSVEAGPCIVWSSLVAPAADTCTSSSGGTGSTTWEQYFCGVSNGQSAYMYFRNAITGGKDCVSFTTPPPNWDSTSGDRESIGTEPRPPPPPSVIAQVSSSGKTQTSVTTADGNSVTVGKGDSLFQDFSTLDVNHGLHNWRHEACQNGAKCQ